MTNILLCGNGINIQFNKDFCFQEFLNILIDEKKLEDLIHEILLNPEYQKFKSIKQDFLEIFEKCQSSILNLDQESKNNGVEIAILNFKNSVRVLMSQLSLNLKKEIFEKFEEFFDLLFFYYLNKLEKKNIINLMKRADWNINFRNYLKRYQYIYTLNYDSLLGSIYQEKYIHYVHGKLKVENNKLNYKDCVFESYVTPKWRISSKTNLPIFLDMKSLKDEFCLDIVGLNPKNDEEIFLFFFLSQICKEINYYYHSSTDSNDLKNISELIEYIKYWNSEYQGITLIKSKDFVEIEYEEEKPGYSYSQKIGISKDQSKLIYKFKFWKGDMLDHLLTVNLKDSKDFWSKVNKNQTTFSVVSEKSEEKIV